MENELNWLFAPFVVLIVLSSILIIVLLIDYCVIINNSFVYLVINVVSNTYVYLIAGGPLFTDAGLV